MDREEWEFRLANQCGPVFEGIAAANCITLHQEHLEKIKTIVAGSSISLLPLWEERERVAALFYRHSFLESFLKKDAVNCLLEQLGYSGTRLDLVLSGFEKRYQRFRLQERAFPHELGLLLGFPSEDVRGFILHQGRDYLMSGYWKVYHNLPYAQMRFLEYDHARISCMKKIREDASWKEAIVSSFKPREDL